MSFSGLALIVHASYFSHTEPQGNLNMFDFSQTGTRDALGEFGEYVSGIQNQIDFKVSSRGWCYLLEQAGDITKDEFDKVEKWINRCRSCGILPIDFVAEEAARQFSGVENPSDLTPVEDLGLWLDALEDGPNRYDVDWWSDEEFYVQMLVEKVDLVTLFEPVCRRFHIPIGNARGWSSMLQRASYARRFELAEHRGLKCVLLYCGDHDPDGLRIGDFLRKNLDDLRDVQWSDGLHGFDPVDLIIDRFGLQFDFIEQNRFSWIDNLITGSGKNLASPTHKNHGMFYVQHYLKKVGERKCEANVLVTQPAVARELCRSAITGYLGEDAERRFADRRREVLNYVDDFGKASGFTSLIGDMRTAFQGEEKIMGDRHWWNHHTTIRGN